MPRIVFINDSSEGDTNEHEQLDAMETADNQRQASQALVNTISASEDFVDWSKQLFNGDTRSLARPGDYQEAEDFKGNATFTATHADVFATYFANPEYLVDRTCLFIDQLEIEQQADQGPMDSSRLMFMKKKFSTERLALTANLAIANILLSRKMEEDILPVVQQLNQENTAGNRVPTARGIVAQRYADQYNAKHPATFQDPSLKRSVMDRARSGRALDKLVQAHGGLSCLSVLPLAEFMKLLETQTVENIPAKALQWFEEISTNTAAREFIADLRSRVEPFVDLSSPFYKLKAQFSMDEFMKGIKFLRDTRKLAPVHPVLIQHRLPQFKQKIDFAMEISGSTCGWDIDDQMPVTLQGNLMSPLDVDRPDQMWEGIVGHTRMSPPAGGGCRRVDMDHQGLLALVHILAPAGCDWKVTCLRQQDDELELGDVRDTVPVACFVERPTGWSVVTMTVTPPATDQDGNEEEDWAASEAFIINMLPNRDDTDIERVRDCMPPGTTFEPGQPVHIPMPTLQVGDSWHSGIMAVAHVITMMHRGYPYPEIPSRGQIFYLRHFYLRVLSRALIQARAMAA